MPSKIDDIRRDVSLPDLAASYGVKLDRNGKEWTGCCPFHADDTPSFSIFPGKDGVQRFHCFGCQEHGDVVDFVRAIKGVDAREAIAILGGSSAGPNVERKQVPSRDVYAGIIPVPAGPELKVGERIKLYNPKRAGTDLEWGSFSPSMVFPYRLADGALLGYVLRREMRDGGKETPMVMRVCLANGTECWSRFPFPKPRPLYGLDMLRDGQAIVVEGEKCRDKLVEASGRNVVTWPGGTQGVKHADWSPLAGRDVVIWPDADEPGAATAQEIAKIVADSGGRARILDVAKAARWNGEAPPKGWDAADAVAAGWSRQDIDTFMRETVGAPVVNAPVEPVEARPEPAPDVVLAKPAKAVPQARTVEQAEAATVTDIRTRRTVKADDGWQVELVCNEEGRPKPGVSKNWALYLENRPEMRGVLAFDEFKQRVMLMRRPPWEAGRSSWQPRGITDRDFAECVMWLESCYLTPKGSNIMPVVQAVAERARFDRLTDYLTGLEWDGVPRVEEWLSTYLGVGDTPYSRAIARRWLIAAVARGLEPGCKVDTMPILEGPQGFRKSYAVRSLYGAEFFTDNLSDIGSKDAKIELQGVWGLEVAEMQRFSAADVNAVKKFLTQQIDRYRPPYGKTAIDAPRRVILNGTINPEGNPYLRDPTGARRFWPVVVGKIDTDALERDRDLLWAEAVAMFREGQPHWIQEEEQAAVLLEQDIRTDVDVWTSRISPMLQTRVSVTQWEVFEVLSLQTKDVDHRHAGRVGRIMKKLGWDSRRDRSDGKDEIVYFDPARGPDAKDTLW